MDEWFAGRWGHRISALMLAAALVGPGWTKPGIAHADRTREAAESSADNPGRVADITAEYHTPLAGEPLHTVFLGNPVDIPALDRGRLTALTLGGEYYFPREGDTAVTPFGALYVKRVWEKSRTRDVISIFVNDLEYDRSLGNLELVARFENDTIPGGQKEVVNNREIASSDTEWGTVTASLGPGWRCRVAPFQVDNDLRLQLLGKVGYFYATRTGDTGANQTLPRDTMLYGLKLRGRYDGMRRNLLELPHSGLAAGFDLDYTYRDKWADFGTYPDQFFSGKDTRSYFQFNGYLMGVGGIPGLSEKNRMLFSLHGGTTPRKSTDRFNAMTIGGGPLPSETDDLYRPDYPGTVFNQVLVSDYALATLEYRRELAFFIYLHLRETLIWADRATITATDRFQFTSSTGAATTIGIDTGFFWDSVLYLGYSWDSGFIRNGTPGSGVNVTWNKLF